MGKTTFVFVALSLSLGCGLEPGPMGPSAGGGAGAGGGNGAGGGPSRPTPSSRHDEVTSGSRLKARRLKGSDGSEMFIGWWDSKLQRDCSFGIAADGATRCLPTEPRRVVQAAYPNELYADAECKQRLGQLAASADCKADALPAVQLWSTTVATPASTCEVNATRVMVVGARLPESAVVYSRKTGACQAVLLTAEQATTGFFVMSELPATDFQAVEPVVDP